jgi:hypothetical protein
MKKEKTIEKRNDDPNIKITSLKYIRFHPRTMLLASIQFVQEILQLIRYIKHHLHTIEKWMTDNPIIHRESLEFRLDNSTDTNRGA